MQIKEKDPRVWVNKLGHSFIVLTRCPSMFDKNIFICVFESEINVCTKWLKYCKVKVKNYNTVLIACSYHVLFWNLIKKELHECNIKMQTIVR